MDENPAIRRRLIALNTGENLARDSICKLSRCVNEWLSTAESTSTLAQRFAIPTADMAEARRLTRATDRLAQLQLSQAEDSGTQIITRVEPAYPTVLRQLELPPPVLYCRGRIPDSPAIAIVGSRQATPQGLEVAELFGRDLAARGLTVVSGFARGIDLAAHRGALSSVDGRTVAVLGCGLDVNYPSGRRRIRRTMISRGALVSEFPFGAQPRAWNFPIRNRIIAALALGVLVVQGTPKSGSLITARLALDLGRDVYGIPGSIFDPRSAGPNHLIQDGALLVKRPEEIVASLPLSIRDSLNRSPQTNRPTPVGGPPGEVLQAMSAGQMVTAEKLAAMTGKTLDQVLAILLELEMTGLVTRSPGAVFCRRP